MAGKKDKSRIMMRFMNSYKFFKQFSFEELIQMSKNKKIDVVDKQGQRIQFRCSSTDILALEKAAQEKRLEESGNGEKIKE